VNDYVWRQLVTKIQAAEGLEKQGRIELAYVPELGKSDGIRAEIEPRVKQQFAGKSVQIKAGHLQEIDKLVAQFRRGVADSLKNPAKPQSIAHDPAVEKAQNAALARELTRPSGELTLKKTIVEQASWQLRKNDYGIVVSHFKTTWTLVAVANESYCVSIRGDVWQNADDHGTFEAKMNTDHAVDTFIVPCSLY
jgi:hypothetical protein